MHRFLRGAKKIAGGDEWKKKIESAIETASVAVLLVSVDFLTSAFVLGEEVPKLLRRREQDNLPVVPVILHPCGWKDIAWLGGSLQVLPRGGKPLSGKSEYALEKSLTSIASEISALVLRAARPPAPGVTLAHTGPASSSAAPTVAQVMVPPGVTLHPFEFETVTVSEGGEVRKRRKLRGQSFIEDLGGGVTLEMVALPGGTFTMGAPASEAESAEDERPQHTVTIAPFSIGKFQVTQAQWRAVAGLPRVAHDLDPDVARFQGANRPVERVSWLDTVEFCARLSRKTGRTCRLPSEAEWEYAARAGTITPFAFGPTITPALVNYDGNYPYGSASKGEDRQGTVDVGSLGVANAFGLFDMHGNVWEWTQDVWHDNYDGAPNDGRAWETGGEPNRRVLRGGAWDNHAWICRSAVRGRLEPEGRNLGIGFRVVCADSRTQ